MCSNVCCGTCGCLFCCPVSLLAFSSSVSVLFVFVCLFVVVVVVVFLFFFWGGVLFSFFFLLWLPAFSIYAI